MDCDANPVSKEELSDGEGEKGEKTPEVKANITLMLKRISNSDAFFKSQQRNEPDLKVAEKLEICTSLLQKNPSLFLSRYSNYLVNEDLEYFRNLKDDYEVNFHIVEVEKQLKDKGMRKKIRNRRFEALKSLSTGDYFSDSEMRQRNPLLYEQMVGRFLTDDERQEISKQSEVTLSSMFMDQIQREDTEKLMGLQKEMEESTLEEEEDDDDESCDIEDDSKTISDEQKLLFRHEFVSLMKQNFIDGNDQDFNYNDVDFNEEYDSITISQQDAEDKYFDSQEPT